MWTLCQTQPPENIDFVQKNDDILFDLYTWLYFIYLQKYSLISLKCMFTGFIIVYILSKNKCPKKKNKYRNKNIS